MNMKRQCWISWGRFREWRLNNFYVTVWPAIVLKTDVNPSSLLPGLQCIWIPGDLCFYLTAFIHKCWKIWLEFTAYSVRGERGLVMQGECRGNTKRWSKWAGLTVVWLLLINQLDWLYFIFRKENESKCHHVIRRQWYISFYVGNVQTIS